VTIRVAAALDPCSVQRRRLSVAFDWSTLSPQACEGYIRIGRRYSSASTLAQANQTLSAASKHAAELALHGFGPADLQRLTDARDALEAAGAGRGGDARARMDARRAHREALRRARTQRASARSVLTATARDLRETGGPEAEEAARAITTALQQTSRAPMEAAEALVQQLTALEAVLTLPPVVAASADRGGPASLSALQEAREALRSADRERPGTRGTPEATERLDLLDGVVVELTRQARRAARGAAVQLGTPALLSEFALMHLQQGRSRPAPEPAEPAPEA
jgi:hypothetical protein